MKQRLARLLIALILVLAHVTVHAQRAPKIPDPVARFWKRFNAAKSIRFTMKQWGKFWGTDLATEAKPGRSVFYVVSTYDVKVERPDHLRVSSSPGLEREVVEGGVAHREFLVGGATILVANGKRAITYLPQIHVYMTESKRFARLGRYPTDEEYIRVINEVFNCEPMAGYRLGPESAAERSEYHLIPESLAESRPSIAYLVTDPTHPQYATTIYFDRKTGELLQKSDLVQDTDGKWKEASRYEFQFWDFNPSLPHDTFSIRPMRSYLSVSEYNARHKAH